MHGGSAYQEEDGGPSRPGEQNSRSHLDLVRLGHACNVKADRAGEGSAEWRAGVELYESWRPSPVPATAESGGDRFLLFHSPFPGTLRRRIGDKHG